MKILTLIRQIPPTTTSTATPMPEINEETLRHLNKVFRSIPRELDDVAAYAELTARLGISRSKNHALSPKPKISPNSPTSPKQSPIHPSPSSPTQPMQCSADTADEEELGEDYGQLFAIPSPAGCGGFTLVHKPHLTEGGGINNEEEEEFHPLFDYGETEKEEPLRRQTRRMTTDRLLEEAENLKTHGEEGTVVQRPCAVWRLVDEEEPEEPQIQEAGHEEMATEGSLAREKRERKRKRNESILSTSKRNHPADTEVTIADASEPVAPQPGDEGSDSNGEELRWTRMTRRQQGKAGTSLSIAYSPQHVVLTPALRQQMLEFDDPKMQKKVHQRVTSQKKLKAGKMLHEPSLERIEMKERFLAYIANIGFEWLLEVDEAPVPKDLAKEFHILPLYRKFRPERRECFLQGLWTRTTNEPKRLFHPDGPLHRTTGG